MISIHTKKTLLYQLFTKTVHISTLVEPNQMKLGFAITNEKASYIAKKDSICLFSIAKEVALNEQQLQPCVPLNSSSSSSSSSTTTRYLSESDFYKKR